MYWCYGFRPGWPAERRDRPEAGCLYLIALCRQEPSASETKQWSRWLQEEARSLPLMGVTEKSSPASLAPRYELWLALPRGASLTPVTGERRMSWEDLAQLLQQTSAQIATTPSSDVPQGRGENPARLSELEARAQWLEDELVTAREQFRRQTSRNLVVDRSAEHEPLPAESSHPAAGFARELADQLALSVNLLLDTAALLALQSQSDPQALEAIRDIQRRTEKLADTLRLQEDRPPEDFPRGTKPPLDS